MRIIGLSLKNFRSFQNLSLDLSENINLIVGENNSGKTNISVALNKIRNIFQKREDLINELPSILQENDWFQKNLSNSLEISIKFKIDDEERDGILNNAKLRLEKSRGFSDDVEYYGPPEPDYYPDDDRHHDGPPDDYTVVTKTSEEKVIELLSEKLGERIIRIELNRNGYEIDLSFCLSKDFFKNYNDIYINKMYSYLPKKKVTEYIFNLIKVDFINNFNDNVKDEEIINFLEENLDNNIKIFEGMRKKPISNSQIINETLNGEGLPNILFSLKIDEDIEKGKKFNQIQEMFRKFFPNLNIDVRLQEENPVIIIENKNNNTYFLIEEMGLGVFEILLILTNVINSNYRIFIIEEPELHLHPTLQHRLSSFLNENTTDNQIFIITHSTHFITPENIPSLIRVINLGRSSIANNFNLNDLVTRRIARGVTGATRESTIARLSKYFYYGGILSGFFAKTIVLCEGESELQSMKIWAQLIGKNFDKENIVLVQAMSKFSMIDIAELYDSFGIPVYLIFDSDSNCKEEDKGNHLKNNKWLVEFAGSSIKEDEFIPDDLQGDKYFIFDPDLETSLKNTDSEYASIETKINSRFALETRRHKGIRACQIALTYKEQKKDVPEIMVQLINNLYKFIESYD